MLRSRLIAVAIVTTGLIPIAFGTSTLAPKPAGPTTFGVLSDALSNAGGTPEQRFQPRNTPSSNAFLVLLDPLQPYLENEDESAWLYHAWEIRQHRDKVVGVAEMRELPTRAEPTYLASRNAPAVDTQELALALAEEADSEAQAEPPPAPETGAQGTRFAPQAVVVLTLFVGLLGLIFVKPRQLPGCRP